MSDEQQQQQQRQNCCRLCLAPDNECISILNSYAADKEPLATKIYSCVSVKISPNDRLSLSICHACISYLNSWQSFKNRCLASQNKQRSWLESGHNNTKKSAYQQDQGDTHHDDQQAQDDMASVSGLAPSILEGITSLKKRKSLTVYPVPAVQIKDEPIDADDDYNSTKQHDESDEIVDPTMFLERTADEGDEPLMDSSHYGDYEAQRLLTELKPLPTTNLIKMDTKEASCRACNLKFSTRANARRHERNLHPTLFDSLSTGNSNSSLNKQTAALNASLELQRAVAAAVAADACKLNTSGLISNQKYRQEVVNAFNNSEMGGWDYDCPEKYQQLLTDEKIVFLQQNEEFLLQYQTMTCRCCNKYYSTYKKFMAHMRKKYLTLPRNLCFNCLKLNDSKALFISHLKRRNCINLYKILQNLMAKNANFAAAVTATVAATPEKMRAKELLVNKMYECKLCPKTFRLKLEFRSHVYDEHAAAQRKDIGTTQCSFCAVDIEDPAERKRHYNNMECIVILRCVTCDTKHENQHKFMEHVQEKHLAAFRDQPQFMTNADNSPGKKSSMGASSADDSRSSSFKNLSATVTPAPPAKSQCFSRMPQACPICGQQYNNYNNVLRHMESKHPDQLPQTYKCVKCGVGYPRLSNLRDHMVNVHDADKTRHTGFEYIVNAETVKPTGHTNNQNVYSGRYDYVMKDLMSITNGGTTVDDDEGGRENAAKKLRLDNNATTQLSNNNNSVSITPVLNGQKECPICKAVFNNNIGLSNHMRSHQLQNPMAAKAAMAGSSSFSTPPVQQTILKRTLEQAADRRFRRMRCRICQRRFSTKKSYRYHMLNDHQIRNVQFIKCQLCDAEFAYEKGLKVHMFKVHNTLLKDEMIIKQYECEICSIVYRTDVELQHHLANVHGKQGEAQDNDDDDYGEDSLMGAADNSSAGADASGISTPISGIGNTSGAGGNSASGNVPLYWYQCKYCPSNFNTNKKLAIHINSHDEFDSNDYSCKDCGNVYSGRKSLWVHRYKKHPQIAEPSECHLCKKVFFDTQMLENHTPTCNRRSAKSGGTANSESTQPIYKHKTGDDDDDEDEASRDDDDVEKNANTTSVAANTTSTTSASLQGSGLKIKLPEVACTICGARFTDQDLFSKHIQMHEMELYTDNPLASMFDTGPADPNQFYMDRMNENGEYACDLCSKIFTQMTALKVHRKWHFRGDSKQNEADQRTSNLGTFSSTNQQQQHQDQSHHSIPINHQRLLGLQAVGLMPRQSVPLSKSQKRKRELKCEYCPSTFISNNNLRRHLYELHKNEIGNLPVPPKIELDVPNNCRRCNLKFESKADWIEHKVADARVMKPFGPFQWGCDLCGTYVSRKEKLINHIHNHMKEAFIIPIEQSQSAQKGSIQQTQSPKQLEQQKTSKSDQTEELLKVKIKQEPLDNTEVPVVTEQQTNNLEESCDSAKDHYDDVDEVEDEVDEDEVERRVAVDEYDEDSAADEEELDEMAVGAQQTVGDEDEDLDEDGDEAEDEEVDSDEFDDDEDEDSLQENRKRAPIDNVMVKSRYPCDLCQVFFDSQQDLQKHVKMHFLNGPGSVTLTEIKAKSSSSSKSRSSSSDVVTLSTT
uniref:Zinc finger protein hangover n=1 Tax=Glossina pallidipes TaxID=7398 RepID=A0A1A9Z658_GLOPL